MRTIAALTSTPHPLPAPKGARVSTSTAIFSLHGGRFPQETITAPTQNDPVSHQNAWREAQAFEATFMANIVEDVFKDTLNTRHSVINDEEGEDIFAQTMAEAYGEAMVETGTEIASGSIAGDVYEGLLKDLNTKQEGSL